MIIGLNLLYLLRGVNGGTESYARGLVDGLGRAGAKHEFVVYLNRSAADWPLPDAGNFRRAVCAVDGASRGVRYAYEQMVLPLRLRRDQVDVVHSLGYVGPLLVSCSSVVTIHDLNYKACPMSALRRSMLSFFVRQSALRADRIIAVSEFTRRELAGGVPEAAEKISVIYEAASRRQIAPEPLDRDCLGPSPPVPYAVAFSSRSPHKNILRLVDAFRRARARSCLPHRLVVIGRVPDGMILDNEVISVGFQPDEVVARLLAGAEFLAFPSTYEGFGLPLLEAMEAGLPVLCSSAGSLPEIAADAALIFDPYSVDEMEVAITRMATDAKLVQDLRARGRRNLERFSWDKAARETVAVYEQLQGERRRGRAKDVADD
ncbi:glycosyltransferase family 4 protein [Acidithiobacillus sp.]|uniref:glycosyltransferase family 4 protein n=1 Tax=Acidithiobacillus sp. TaxID=1872118 RepID=UPI003D063194